MDAEHAREQAREADKALARSQMWEGPLHGVPFTLKDVHSTGDMRELQQHVCGHILIKNMLYNEDIITKSIMIESNPEQIAKINLFCKFYKGFYCQ